MTAICREEIENWFRSHRQEMMDDVCELVRIRSVYGTPTEGKPFGNGPYMALQKGKALAARAGLSVTDYDGYVVAADLNDGARRLEILAHLDVVPASGEWEQPDPFEPIVRGDRIYGRGSADNKGSAVAALYAFRCIKELKIPLTGNARLIFGADEECGSRDLAHYYGKTPFPPAAFAPDAGFPIFNLEKGRFVCRFQSQWKESDALPRVVSVQAGTATNIVPEEAQAVVEGMEPEILRVYCRDVSAETGVRFAVQGDVGACRITASGKAAHAGSVNDPARCGNNALTGLLQLLASIPFAASEGQSRLRSVHKLFLHGDCSGRMLGIRMQDEDGCELTASLDMFEYMLTSLTGVGDCRLPCCATQRICEAAAKCLAEEELQWMPERPVLAHYVPPDSEVVQKLLRCYRDWTGDSGGCRTLHGETYAHGIPNAVAFGIAAPGRQNGAHEPDEFVAIEDILLAGQIYTQAIWEFCK